MICSKYVRKIFSSSDTGYTVAVYRPLESLMGEGKPVKEFTAIGRNLPTVNAAGIACKLDGEWVRNSYGLQFKVSSFKIVVKNSQAGICSYLKTVLKINEEAAKKVYQAYGKDSIHMLKEQPDQVMKTAGCSKASSSFTLWRLRAHLTALGIPDTVAQKIFNVFGDDAIKAVQDNPYLLCKYVQFDRVDKIVSRSEGFNPANYQRLSAIIRYILKSAETHGHLFLTRDYLVRQALEVSGSGGSVTYDVLNDTVSRMLVEHIVSKVSHPKYGDLIYLQLAARAENDTAVSIIRLMVRNEKLLFPDTQPEIVKVEKALGMTFSNKQKKALEMVFSNSLSVITGFPGTGKTTVLRGIVQIQKNIKDKSNILLCSPTGRAARRMTETTGMEASTIHSALHITEDDINISKEYSLNGYDLIIVDEISMIDICLADVFLSAISNNTRVVLVGDDNQLPSVGPGMVLSELIRSHVVPVTQLDEIFRQAQESKIIRNAQKIREGNADLEYGPDFRFFESKSPKDAANKAVAAYFGEIVNCGCKQNDIEILTPWRQKYPDSSDGMNVLLRDKVNKPSDDKTEIKFGKRVFRQGDRVMQIRNNADLGVSNGDIGRIEQIFPGDSQKAIINFGSNRKVAYSPSDFKSLTWAYAITVHKSQGSEFQTIIFVLCRTSPLVTRNLVHTAITRAKKKVIFVGSKSALAEALRVVENGRNTLLADRICSYWKQYERKQAAETKMRA